MKKFLSIIIAAAVMLSVGICACAENTNHADDYYWQHKGEVTPVGKKYIVNSPDGYVTGWNSPEEKRAYGNISNGTALEVTASYLGWNAITYINADGLEQCYWIPSDLMTEQISGETFLRDNSERLSYDMSELKSMKYYSTDGTIYLYSYPGSGLVSSELENIGKFDTGPVFTVVYTDFDGYKWGYLEYYGDWNYKAWVCLNDPENGELPAKNNGNTIYEPVIPCSSEAKIHYSAALKDTQQQTAERLIIGAAAVIFASVLIAILIGAGRRKDKPRKEKSKKENAPREPKPEKEKRVKEPKPEKEKRVKEPKPEKEKRVKEPKPEKEKRVKEPKPEKEKRVKEPKPEKEKRVKEPKPEKEKRVKEPKPEKEKHVKKAKQEQAKKPETAYPETEFQGEQIYSEEKLLEESWQKKIEERKTKHTSHDKKGRHEK